MDVRVVRPARGSRTWRARSPTRAGRSSAPPRGESWRPRPTWNQWSTPPPHRPSPPRRPRSASGTACTCTATSPRWNGASCTAPSPTPAPARCGHAPNPAGHRRNRHTLVHALRLADSASGIGSQLDLAKWLIINTDLTVALHRDPIDEWLCMAASLNASPGGSAPARRRWPTARANSAAPSRPCWWTNARDEMFLIEHRGMSSDRVQSPIRSPEGCRQGFSPSSRPPPSR